MFGKNPIVFTSGDGKITSARGEGHKWFLESPQVKIMFLLSDPETSTVISILTTVLSQ
jgi:hypothetical protein